MRPDDVTGAVLGFGPAAFLFAIWAGAYANPLGHILALLRLDDWLERRERKV